MDVDRGRKPALPLDLDNSIVTSVKRASQLAVGISRKNKDLLLDLIRQMIHTEQFGTTKKTGGWTIEFMKSGSKIHYAMRRGSTIIVDP